MASRTTPRAPGGARTPPAIQVTYYGAHMWVQVVADGRLVFDKIVRIVRGMA